MTATELIAANRELTATELKKVGDYNRDCNPQAIMTVAAGRYTVETLAISTEWIRWEEKRTGKKYEHRFVSHVCTDHPIMSRVAATPEESQRLAVEVALRESAK